MAAGTSLVLVFANSAAAGASFARKKLIAFDLALPLCVAAIPGSIAGAFVSARAAGSWFDIAYAFFLCAIAIDIVRRAVGAESAKKEGRRAVALPAVLLAGVAGGFFSSLFGIGGGVLVVPFLLYASAAGIHRITATSTAVIALTAPVGIAAHALSHDLSLVPAIALGAGGLAGGLGGAALAPRIPARILRLVLAGALILAALAMAARHF